MLIWCFDVSTAKQNNFNLDRAFAKITDAFLREPHLLKTTFEDLKASFFQGFSVIGFIDGEGSFSVTIGKHKTLKRGIVILPEFEIEVRADDRRLHRLDPARWASGPVSRGHRPGRSLAVQEYSGAVRREGGYPAIRANARSALGPAGANNRTPHRDYPASASPDCRASGA